MANNVAQAREVDGTRYNDPMEYLVAGGFNEAEAREVVNAYKAFYGQGKKRAGHWLDYVTQVTSVKDETRAQAIMRRYRQYYGK